jgi:hypothetical protein
LPHGLAMVLGGGVALKGCAARTGKPAAALDRDTAAKRIAVMPLWLIADSRGIPFCHFPKSTSVTGIEISQFPLPHPTAILLKVVCNIRRFAKGNRNLAQVRIDHGRRVAGSRGGLVRGTASG